MMDDQSEAIKVVIKFTAAMNDWEYKMHTFSRLEDGKYVSDANRSAIAGVNRESLDQYFYRNLKNYCTASNLKEGGKPSSWGDPTKYSGVDGDSIMGVVTTPDNSIEVVTRSDYFAETIYKFILVKKRC